MKVMVVPLDLAGLSDEAGGSLEKYVDGEVHASDVGKCHPSIRGETFGIFSIFICMCVLLYHITIVILPH